MKCILFKINIPDFCPFYVNLKTEETNGSSIVQEPSVFKHHNRLQRLPARALLKVLLNLSFEFKIFYHVQVSLH